MPKKKTGTKKRNLGQELIQGFEELKQHREGNVQLKTTTISTEENQMNENLDPRVLSVLNTVKGYAYDLNQRYDNLDARNRFAYLIGTLVVLDFALSAGLYKLTLGVLVALRFAYLNKNLNP